MKGLTNAINGATPIGEGTLIHRTLLETPIVQLNYKVHLLKKNNLYIATLKSGESNISQFLLWYTGGASGGGAKTVVKTTENDKSYYNATLGLLAEDDFQFYDDTTHFTFTDGAIYDIYEAK